MASLDSLLDMLTPKAIISIHTDNPRHFADMFCEKWPVILLEDGESFSAIRDPGFDTTTAFVIAFQTPDNSYEVIDNPENLQWWTVDKNFSVNSCGGMTQILLCITLCMRQSGYLAIL